ncbi:Hypothetical predicted protein [Cloeon dipterum]|uniref:Uncharacterized protein n=1 Tax=Cloeon dipterum TaxID=197152 RepID=A0A8S1E6P4_9INSE|nr:Hypothetical predicted protein [Cloeon dipterum]
MRGYNSRQYRRVNYGMRALPDCRCGCSEEQHHWLGATLKEVLDDVQQIKHAVFSKPDHQTLTPTLTLTKTKSKSNLTVRGNDAKIFEIAGDLFQDAPEDAALAHCVEAHFLMAAVLAVTFKELFGNVDYLKTQQKRPGQTAALRIRSAEDGYSRIVFYLVTKPRSANANLTQMTSKQLFETSPANAPNIAPQHWQSQE